MATYKLAAIAGDGIGPEVMQVAKDVLTELSRLEGELAFEIDDFDWGCEYYLKEGKMMPEDGIAQLSAYDAILLGAVGYPGVPDHISLRELLLKIRHDFDQYVNIRPVKLLPGAPKALLGAAESDIDMIFIRENSEGEYAGSGAWLYPNTERECVIQHGVFSRHGCERVMRYAFELAKREGKTLTSISKANALNYSMVFWDQIFNELKAEYPEVKTASYLVDAAAMLMVKDPKRFEVVVCSNLFGDILTDLGAAISGGMGLAAGANINPERRFPSMFEPIHGSAPDIAGKGLANPFAMIWSVAQLLEHLGETKLSQLVLDSLAHNLKEQIGLTPDLGGKASTSSCGEAFLETLMSKYQSLN